MKLSPQRGGTSARRAVFAFVTLCVLAPRIGRAAPPPAAPVSAEAVAEVNAAQLAVEHRPDDPEAHKNLGNALIDLGEYGLAIQEFRTAIHLNPRYAKAYHNLGRAMYYVGDLNGSVAAYREALRLQPIYPMDEWQLGITYGAQGRYDLAIAAYHAAIHENPTDADYYSDLTWALCAAGRNREALKAVRAFAAGDPDDMSRLSDVGMVYRRLGQEATAWRVVSEAHALAPDCPVSNLDMAILLADKADYTDAIARAQRAVQVDPGWTQARQVLTALLHARTRRTPLFLNADGV